MNNAGAQTRLEQRINIWMYETAIAKNGTAPEETAQTKLTAYFPRNIIEG